MFPSFKSKVQNSSLFSWSTDPHQKELGKYQRGFNLVELIVTLAIVSILLTVIVIRQSSYTDLAQLVNITDEYTLAIAQAQAYANGAKEVSPGSNDFSGAYGVSIRTVGSGTNYFIIFADTNGNGTYNGNPACPTGENDECLERTNFASGYRVASIWSVKSDGTQSNAGRVDVLFVRPSTAALINIYNIDGSTNNDPTNIGARVNLSSPNGKGRSVYIYKTGQVSIQ